MTKQIVILGAGFAGIPIAHKLLKTTIPKLKDTKVILISTSTHFFWALAAVRAVIPDQIDEEKLFLPIAEGFSKYPASQFELLIGTATALDVDANNVTVDVDGTPRSIAYDQLIIATGSRMRADGLPFKHIGSTEATKKALHDIQAQVAAAKSIVIAGDGPTGVETASELVHKYGSTKEITLIISRETALPGLLPSVGKAAEKELLRMKAKLVHKATVTGVEGKSVKLSNGDALTADLYLPLYGLTANTSFVPAKFLDAASGRVKLDANLRVSGTSNVWAAGDVGNLENMQALKAESQVKHLFKNLDAVLSGNEKTGVTDYKKSDKPFIFVTLGPAKGTGQMFGFKAFNFMVAMTKCKDFLLPKAVAMVQG